MEDNSKHLGEIKLLGELSENRAAQFWKVPYEQLAPAEQVFASIWELEAQVNNGGFYQYFLNSTGDIARHVVSALERIGALNFAAIAGQAVSVFGPAGPPSDRALRRAQLKKMSSDQKELLEKLDQEFYKYPDNIAELLYAFILKNRNEIRGLD